MARINPNHDVEEHQLRDHLILKLQGPLQAWGTESFEGLRPSGLFPGRSALLGLLGACLGIDRSDQAGQQALASSVLMAVRVDNQGQKLTDYHTVKDARVDYQGLKKHDTIQTWREYWQDARFSVALWTVDGAKFTLEQLHEAVSHPVFTPVLGRRSCPLSRPLFEGWVTAVNALEALDMVEPNRGTVYSDEPTAEAVAIKMRDVPILDRPRRFASRRVFMTTVTGATHVSE